MTISSAFGSLGSKAGKTNTPYSPNADLLTFKSQLEFRDRYMFWSDQFPDGKSDL